MICSLLSIIVTVSLCCEFYFTVKFYTLDDSVMFVLNRVPSSVSNLSPMHRSNTSYSSAQHLPGLSGTVTVSGIGVNISGGWSPYTPSQPPSHSFSTTALNNLSFNSTTSPPGSFGSTAVGTRPRGNSKAKQVTIGPISRPSTP